MFNEGPVVDIFYERTSKILEGLGLPWEIVAVNDGSRDDTLERMVALHRKDPRFLVIDLSRNFGKEVALTAGLDFARGDAVVPIDADLQDPPELIPTLVARWREGHEVVIATRTVREGETWVKRATANAFYRTIGGLSRTEIPRDTGDFRLLSRKALDAVRTLRERRRFMKGLFSWIGFKTVAVPYAREARVAGGTKWNYWKLWNFAIEGITSFSIAPLQVASYFGALVAVLAFLYGSWMIFQTLAFGNDVKGYPSLIVIVLFLGGVQLLTLGVLGEYVGRIYDESKGRPLYFVREAHGVDPDRAGRS